ncbi:stress response small protein YobI [Escherichia coli]
MYIFITTEYVIFKYLLPI